MEFDLFKNKLKERIGGLTQIQNLNDSMSPFKSFDRKALLHANPNPRLSAVMILVFNKLEKAHIALIRRPVYDGVHSGQIAFPGGSWDETDDSLKETALRELFEEVGVEGQYINVIGEIEKVYIPPSKFLVTPFVGIIDRRPEFVKDDFEVAEVLEVPVSLLFDESIIKSGDVLIGKQNEKIKVPYFDIFGHMVWGATAIMLNDFKTIMK